MKNYIIFLQKLCPNLTNKNFAKNNIFKMKSNINNVNLEDINLNNVSNHTPEVMAATLKADGNWWK